MSANFLLKTFSFEDIYNLPCSLLVDLLSSRAFFVNFVSNYSVIKYHALKQIKFVYEKDELEFVISVVYGTNAYQKSVVRKS